MPLHSVRRRSSLSSPAASSLLNSAVVSSNFRNQFRALRHLNMAEKRVTLKSRDNEIFEVDVAVALELKTVKNIIEDLGIDGPIPLPNVSGKTLAKVIEYCKYHVENAKTSEDEPAIPEDVINAWDAEFVKVDQETLFDLVLAVNYLNIPNLLHLTCQTVADKIAGKSVEEIRKMFNITNDLTPKEEEEVRTKHAWAFS